MRERLANPWRTEIDELHAFFEAYFLGRIPKGEIARVEQALARDFTLVAPGGTELDRRATLAGIEGAHGSTETLDIAVTEHRLIASTDDHAVATYVESHHELDRSTHRVTTVVFARDPDGPNGLRWLRVHETWRVEPD